MTRGGNPSGQHRAKKAVMAKNVRAKDQGAIATKRKHRREIAVLLWLIVILLALLLLYAFDTFRG